MPSSITLAPSKAAKTLKFSIHLWFWIVVIGQFIFALYILGLYGVNGLAGDFERWNAQTTHGYVERDLMGNIFFGLHVALAAIITIGGPLQLMKRVRGSYPRFHRINGRIYVIAAFVISMAGFYLTWVRGASGGLIGQIFVSINGLFILVCTFFAVHFAMAKKLASHRKWAIRLFLAMSGVWFFRVFLMFWLTINQGPVGFDMETFQGPALNVISTCSYILPVLFAEAYFWAKTSSTAKAKWSASVFLWILTACITLGSATATLGMWLPNL